MRTIVHLIGKAPSHFVVIFTRSMATHRQRFRAEHDVRSRDELLVIESLLGHSFGGDTREIGFVRSLRSSSVRYFSQVIRIRKA